jgi:hypothetical protein
LLACGLSVLLFKLPLPAFGVLVITAKLLCQSVGAWVVFQHLGAKEASSCDKKSIHLFWGIIAYVSLMDCGLRKNESNEMTSMLKIDVLVTSARSHVPIASSILK